MPTVQFPAEAGVFLFTNEPRQGLEHTQHPIQGIVGVTGMEHKADNRFPVRVEVKNVRGFVFTPHISLWLGG
jgi:hypothetical protein